jgi:YHS domain-containing protein
MTGPRRQWKPGALFVAGAIAAVLAVTWTGRLGAATTEYVVSDSHTGLAIAGFDPVAYFTDAAPKLGTGEFELTYAGVVWSFCNEGNRAAFVADPQVYMPQFGGYDPTGVTRGVAVPGDPRLWMVSGERLYLFYTEKARTTFAADPDQIKAAAEGKWPAVQLTLSP